jgi:cell shape-determining protein MreD
MGEVPMNWLNTTFVLGAAFLAVFCEAAFSGVRHLVGAQLDLLPPLMVYAALCTGLTTVTLLALCGGLWFDSLSANPLGVTVLPLIAVGLAIHLKRDLILRDQTFARLVLGLVASATVQVLTLLLLLSLGQAPLLSWGTLWQLIVVSIGGAVATPICFELFDWLQRTLVHHRATESSFRADREIRRGRL